MKLKYFLNITLSLVFFITNYGNAQAPNIEWQKSLGGTGAERANSIIQTIDGGYIMAGESNSIDGDVIGNHGALDFLIVKLSATGTLEWQKCLGGTGFERANSIKQTTDGGYIVAGTSNSIDGDAIVNHGSSDYWIVKLSINGTLEWQKSLGGANYDEATSIVQTTDGGFITAGYSNSTDGDISGHHGGGGYNDFWIVKLSSTGTIQWQKSLGGTGEDNAHSIIQTSDGGYVVTGKTESNNGDVIGLHVGCCFYSDYWVVKLNATGTIEWQNTLGGTHEDVAYSIIQTTDGGYIAAGIVASRDGDVTGRNYEDSDLWIIKLSATGTLEWQKSFGGTENDYAYSIIQIQDEGFIVAGDYYSVTGEYGNHGYYDYMILKLSPTGSIQWQKSLGGNNSDSAKSVILSADGGFVVAGHSLSNNGDVTENHGISDAWIVKLFPANLSNPSFFDTTMTFFPNPVKETLAIKVNFFTPREEIIITDIQGKTILNQKVEGLLTTINTSSFESGIYFLNLVDNNQKITKKFIIK